MTLSACVVFLMMYATVSVSGGSEASVASSIGIGSSLPSGSASIRHSGAIVVEGVASEACK